MAYNKTPIVSKTGSQRAGLIKNFVYTMTHNQAQIEKFATEVVADTAYQLTWADKVFTFAAKVSASKQCINLLEHFDTVEEIRDTLQNNVINAAGGVSNKSTSPSSNYMAECALAELANAFERFRYVSDLEAT